MKSSLHICHLSAYPPMSDTNAYYTKRFVTHSSAEGVSSCLLLPTKCTLPDNSIPYTCIQPFNFLTTFRFLKQQKADVLHAQYQLHSYLFNNLHIWIIVLIHCRILGIKTVFTLHGADVEFKRYPLLSSLYYKLFSYFIDAYLIHTGSGLALVRDKAKVNPKMLHHMQHGFHEVERNTKHVDRLRKEWALQGKKVILCFGLIRPDKGVEFLIETMKVIRDKDLAPDSILIIVGDVRKRKGVVNQFFQQRDENYFNHLVDLTAKYDLKDRIQIHRGYVPDDEVYSIFSVSDILALSYKLIGESGVVNIALSIPMPVVATDVGGIGERLRDVGILAPQDDAPAMASAIARVLNDAAYREQTLDNYRTLVNSLNPQQTTHNNIELYRTILEQNTQ